MGLFDNTYRSPGVPNITVDSGNDNQPTTADTCSCKDAGDMNTQYMLLDLNDRRIARLSNVLQIIAALIAIIYFLQQVFKNK